MIVSLGKWGWNKYKTHKELKAEEKNEIKTIKETSAKDYAENLLNEADKDDEGNFKPSTVKLSFKNNLINKKLCTYIKALEIRENMINAKDDYSEEEFNASLQRINENIEEIKQHLLDDNMVVSKGTDRLTVKIFPN